MMRTLPNRIGVLILFIYFVHCTSFGQIDTLLKYMPEVLYGLTQKPIVGEIQKHTPLFKRNLCKDSSFYGVSKFTTLSGIDSIIDSKFMANYNAWLKKKIYFLVIFGDNSYKDYDKKKHIPGSVYCLIRYKRYKYWWTYKNGVKSCPSVDFLYSTKDKTFKFGSPFQ